MKIQKTYETVTEAVSDLLKRGYTTDFLLLAEKDCLICNKTATQLSPEDFEIDETHRFEGITDPSDETIVFAISSSKWQIKGIVLNAYGMYFDDVPSKIVEHLKKHL